MSARKWPRRIFDMLDAIEEIHTFVAGMSFDEFRQDTKTIRAVAADLAVLGEAAGQIPEDIVTAYPDIPWASIKAIRNRLVHVYFDIDPEVVWDTIHHDLPPLNAQLQRIVQDNS